MSSILDYVNTSFNNPDEIMVYGYKTCGYQEIRDVLKAKGKTVYNYGLGVPKGMGEPTCTKYGNPFKILPYDHSVYSETKGCKNGLVTIVFENYKRLKENNSFEEQKPLIPILFSIESLPSPFTFDHAKVLSKDAYNYLVTHSELRRAYKLCHKFENEELRKVAQETFKFVKLHKPDNSSYSLETVQAPWDRPDWDQYWTERQKQRRTIAPKEHLWTEELKKAIEGLVQIPKINE